MRIPREDARYAGRGATEAQILKDFLTRSRDIRASLEYAAQSVNHPA